MTQKRIFSVPTEKGKTMARSKYRAVKVKTEEGTFDSMGEYARWQDLKLLQRAGVITGLKRQVKFELIPSTILPGGKKQRAVTYVADFRYYDSREGKWITEDFKGYQTKEYKLKKKLVFYIYGIDILETGRKDL